jgi:hypothetical protein
MSVTFTKLFSSITESTVWYEPDSTRLVWITMLAMSDRQGRVWASVPGLAGRARVSLESAREALKCFLSPDPDSRTKEYEGRRIEEIDGGWRLLNHAKYRELRDEEARKQYQREWVKERRQKASTVDRSLPPSTNAEAEAYTESEKTKTPTASARPAEHPMPPEFTKFKLTFPMRGGSQPWSRALKAIRVRLREGSTWAELIDGAERYANFCVATGKLGTEYVMQAATFCGPEKRYLELWALPASKADVRLAGNLSAAQEFMQRTEPKHGT